MQGFEQKNCDKSCMYAIFVVPLQRIWKSDVYSPGLQ